MSVRWKADREASPAEKGCPDPWITCLLCGRQSWSAVSVTVVRGPDGRRREKRRLLVWCTPCGTSGEKRPDGSWVEHRREVAPC